MDTLGPRIMVNVGTQAVSTTGLNPRDLAPLTNDAFLATFLGKTSLSSASNGSSRQHNNYRQSYTAQMERMTLRSKPRASAPNGDSSMEPDSAILSVIRGNQTDQQTQSASQRSSQGNRNHRRSLNQQLLADQNDIPCSPNYRPNNDGNLRRRRTRSGGVQQQITVVDQMAAQPHIPYAILPKRFEPKHVSGSNVQQQSRSNNNVNGAGRNRRRRSAAAGPLPRRSQRPQDYYDDQWEDDEEDLWLEPMMRRRLNQRPSRNYPPMNAFYGGRSMQRFDDYYNPYAYGPMPRPTQGQFRPNRRMMYQDDGYIPFDIVPSYDLNEWQGPYARSRQAMQQSRNGYRSTRDDAGFIRDDHRANGSSRQTRTGNKPWTPTRSGKQQAKSPKGKGPNNGSKRRNSRQRKQRNQNSKTEGTPLATSNETTDEEKHKRETTESSEQHNILPPRDSENKENTTTEHKSE